MSRQYINASKAVNAVLSGKSLKTYCSRNKVGKMEYAIICETVKYINVIEKLFDSCEISAVSLDVDKALLLVLCYELLFGSGKIKGGGVVKRRLVENETNLRDALAKMVNQHGLTYPSELIDSHFTQHDLMPVHVRVNTLKVTAAEGMQKLCAIYQNAAVDGHIPNLLVLPPGTSTWDHECVSNGEFIIQDKASCMPSQILFDSWPGGDIIDACAAPGNKTSHLSALVKESGRGDDTKIYAFDKSSTRWELLKSRLKAAAAKNVTALHADFLAVDTNDPIFAEVKSVLVDPSCSGSGVVRSLDRVYERVKNSSALNVEAATNVSAERIEQLRKFQVKAIKQAMSFPKVELVVYSTCSIDMAENESVVAEILQQNSEWTVKEPHRFISWERRGLQCEGLSYEAAQCLIRCSPDDGANGFFVALFCRRLAVTQLDSSGGEGNCALVPINLHEIRRIKRKFSFHAPQWKPISKRLKY